MGWAGLKNGELLRRAAGRFHVFVTVDRGLRFQQNLANLQLAVVVLSAKTNRLADLLPLVGPTLASLERLQPGEVIRVAAEPEIGL